MSSEVVVYGEVPLANAGDVESTRDVQPNEDRGTDWPLAATVFVPVIGTYVGLGYCVYTLASTLL